jgi:hypothetical protein
MTENFGWHDTTAGGISFVDHFWGKIQFTIKCKWLNRKASCEVYIVEDCRLIPYRYMLPLKLHTSNK